MGVVVSARHLQLDTLVALKFMLPGAARLPNARERFLREARASVQLRGENVAKVLDVGTMNDGVPYIVLELLDGEDLGEILDSLGVLEPEQAVDYVLQACAAMTEAHGHGIVHRDLKPANLFLTHRVDGRPLVKVLDFGISKLLRGDRPNSIKTKTGTAVGSPAYMAPEQMKGSKTVDQRADIWSLGAILYRLVTGELPFEADSVAGMFARVMTEAPAPIETYNSDIPAELSAVIMSCLVKDADRRIQTASQLAHQLEPFASDDGRDTVRSISRMSPAATAPVMTREQTAKGRRAALDTVIAKTPVAANTQLTETTHSAAAGQSLVVDTDSELDMGRRKSILPAVGAVAAVAAIAVVIMLSRGGGSSNDADRTPSSAATTDIVDAGPAAVTATATDAAAVVEAPVDAQTTTVANKKDRTKTPRVKARVRKPMTVRKKPTTARKKPTTVRKKPTTVPAKPKDKDPFGTMD